ncbi:MAG: HlyD family efflux transporter periplasmic adaptor subunit [Ruminococcus sp.]|uniref:efflux RND transporter periplasmic adaptor subunit n=1 Tax=Ruminococcus sp. TaxID=41978 RepID=UPI002872DE3A|nr:efflux RND transporter periplasmic adaptor subunit [Ruminococcus sp.]MBQ3285727.1 HlyD family efflux transporter periplasmic adaptor subunit [Ruminococcus sp.]
MSDSKKINPAPDGAETAETVETAQVATSEKTAADSNDSTPEKKNGSRKKRIIIISVIAAVVVIAAIVLIVVLTGNNADAESDEDVEYIDVQTGNYYGGVIEPQQTADVNKDPERTVSDVYVKVGDTVKKGDKLFEYDSNETASKLSKAKIEYESIKNDIAECETRISQLSRQRSEADADQQASYTEQISEQQSSKSQYELNLRIKQVEIDDLQDSLDNSVVTAPISGIIKQINNGSDNTSGAYMTILMNGSYRVKCLVDETNVRSISDGMKVVVHSRVEKDKTWDGTVSKVDSSNPADKSGNNGGMDTGNSDNSATNYYFYVNLDSSDELLLGEHVYVEPVMDEASDISDDAPEQDDAAPVDNAEN